MKAGLRDLIGKRIAAVVVAENKSRDPRQQVFLVFGDGRCFEFHGREFTCNAGLDPAERVERYVEGAGGRIVRVYGDAGCLAPRSEAPATGETVETLMTRDLVAWKAAKAAIAKAKAKGNVD
jgi:hypothetical protein